MTNSSISLEGRIALITGASRGIGAAIAKTYAKAGAHVILLARTIGALEALDDEIREMGGKTTLVPQDLMDLDKIDSLGPLIAQRFGALDIVVGNAGYLGDLTPLAHLSADDWRRTMTLNVDVNFRLIRTLDPLLRASNAGRAIFVTSGMAEMADAYWAPYAASKAALNAMVTCYAKETAKTNLCVNLISPGLVDTAMLRGAYPGGYQGENAPAKPEDITDAFLTLASDKCTQTGQYFHAQDFETNA